MYAQVVEYGPAVILDLTDEQIAALRGMGSRWGKALRLGRNPFEVDRLPEGVAVRAKDVAGFVRVGTLSLDIVPKFLEPEVVGPTWRRSLWRFLAFAQGVDSLRVSTSGLSITERGIADLLADLFVASVDSAALMGFPLGYRLERRLSPFMCGRIDLSQPSRLAIPDGRLPVVRRRLTRDTDMGRLLKWAAQELSRLVETSERRGRLRAWTASMSDVSSTPPTSLRNTATARQFPHLTVAVDIALMLLADHWGEYGNGALNLPGFLWRSETLFEKAMLRLVRKSVHPLAMTADKRSHPLAYEEVDGQHRLISTTPDIDVHQAGQTRILIDAKYKVLSGSPSISDIYQVVSAGQACHIDRVALIYPGAGKGLSIRTLTSLGSGQPQQVDLLSVGLGSFETPATQRELVTELRGWIQDSLGPST